MGITQDQWGQYHRDGFLRIGSQSDRRELEGLQERIDEIMLGQAELDYDRLMMQLDSSTGKYDDVSGGGKGLREPSLNYRKIQ